MAYIGLRNPFVAKFNRATNTYSDGFKYSHAVSLNITPNYSEASLYGDDIQVEYAKSFNNASVSLGTTSTPIEAAEIMFGHTVDRANNQVVYKATDEPNYVGVGVTALEQVDGVVKYSAAIILSVKFTDSSTAYTTKGESLQFSTPTVEGVAIATDDERWMVTKVFDTAEEATAFVKEFLNITEDTYTEVTPEGTENPSELGWYEIVNGVYVLTEDTTVVSGKTYYTRD